MPRRFRLAVSLFSLFVVTDSLRADVPQTINHQGVVKVNGVPFSGTGHFKFAILNASGVNVWTNDNSNLVLNGVPNTAEDVTVADGVYSVILGGTGPAYTMTPIAATVFNESDRRLRIWFDDGTNGIQQLTPDHSLTSSPYSQQTAFQPPIGSIIAWHKSLSGVPALPEGWIECTNPTGTGTISVAGSPLNGQPIPSLNDTPSGFSGGGRFLRGGTTSGVIQLPSRFQVLNDWNHYQWDNTNSIDYDSLSVQPTVQSMTPSIVSGPAPHPGSVVSVRPMNMSVVWIMRVK